MAKVLMVTGGSRGIGAATAKLAAARGYDICFNYKSNAAQAEAVVKDIRATGRAALAVQADTAQDQDVVRLFEACDRELGPVNALVNNAGITGGNGTTWELDPTIWRRVIEVNLIAPYLVCRAVVPHMIARRYGRIVNIASIAGKEGNPNASHYSASKAGVIALTKSLGKELATRGVLVNCVTPAAAKTAMFDTMTQAHIDFMLSKIPMGRFLQAEELAAMVTWLSSEDCAFSTGAVFDLSGGRGTY